VSDDWEIEWDGDVPYVVVECGQDGEPAPVPHDDGRHESPRARWGHD
jgi:hypothetical protein